MNINSTLILIAVTFGGIAFYGTQASPKERLATPLSIALQDDRTNEQKNDEFVKALSARIAGRENEPAEKVFKNIRIPWLRDTPARQFLLIMNLGYSRALGVACTHCHVENDFASDDKRPKRAAREMAFMHRMINEQLMKMQNLDLKPEKRSINCSTCHRGAISPLPIEIKLH